MCKNRFLFRDCITSCGCRFLLCEYTFAFLSDSLKYSVLSHYELLLRKIFPIRRHSHAVTAFTLHFRRNTRRCKCKQWMYFRGSMTFSKTRWNNVFVDDSSRRTVDVVCDPYVEVLMNESITASALLAESYAPVYVDATCFDIVSINRILCSSCWS